MQNHPEHHDVAPADGNNRGLLIGVAVLALFVAIAVLHLTGVIGSGTH